MKEEEASKDKASREADESLASLTSRQLASGRLVSSSGDLDKSRSWKRRRLQSRSARFLKGCRDSTLSKDVDKRVKEDKGF